MKRVKVDLEIFAAHIYHCFILGKSEWFSGKVPVAQAQFLPSRCVNSCSSQEEASAHTLSSFCSISKMNLSFSKTLP